MNKILFGLLLLPMLVSANFYTGEVSMTNGSKKSGLVEVPETDDQTLKFRADLKSEVEKIPIENVSGFEITNKRGQAVHFDAMLLGWISESGKISLDKRKSWVRLEKQSKIALYCAAEGASPGFGPNPGVTAGVPNEKYYVRRPGEDFALLYFFRVESSGMSFAVNSYKPLVKSTKKIFEGICPGLADKVVPDEFKKEGIIKIVALYDANCQ